MTDKKLNEKITTATIWSSVTQIVSKLITPITNMILARILAPEAFGIIATITMIISFVEMFTEAGLQKYIVQKEFSDKKEMNQNANVAFWTNMILSIILLLTIVFFNEFIATLVGNPGLGIVIMVSAIQLPLTAFSSIQMAIYKRNFDFKTLFYIRIIGSLIPLIITIPLALLGMDYWSLVIGMLSMQIFNAIYLTIKSEWKPQFYYDIGILKNMFGFSSWVFLEQITIWFCVWIDTFIISYYLNEYYLGIYKTSTIMVNSLLTLITASVIPVLFSALSRLQDDPIKFNNIYFKFQRLVAMFVLPLGVGVFLFSDLATSIMLGDQWKEAGNVIGIWALTRSILMVYGYSASEAYRAKGRPKLSFYAQLLHLVVLVPVCIITVKYGFWYLVYGRAFIVLQLVVVHFIFLKLFIEISFIKTIKNTLPSIISVIIMGVFGYILTELNKSLIWSFINIFICIIVYFSIILIFPQTRYDLFSRVRKLNLRR